jgi:arsenite methyltransferase
MTITDVVREKYASVATSGLSSDHDGVRAVAEAFGYSPDELASIPAEANMGLSCGNPTAFATLRPGETVLDLGCGGGLDVFLAADKVGPAGKAIGIDMTPEMLALSRRNAAGRTNVEFHQATIDNMPLPDASVDCVISNCVINLALPPEIGNDLMAYVGCVAGAILIDDYRTWLAAAGFDAVQIVDAGKDLNAYSKVEGQSGCCSPSMGDGLPVVSCCSSEVHNGLGDLLARYDVNEYAASVRVFAVKPTS